MRTSWMTEGCRSWRVALAAAAASAMVAPAPTPAEQTTVLARQDLPTSVAVYGGLAVWSMADPATGDYGLASSLHGGPASRLPVAPRSVPFDADVGPDAAGRPVAVYSRCRIDPDGGTRQHQVYLPTYVDGRGCDVYRYDFAEGRETRVAGASHSEVSEVLPSIWRDRLVFARIDPRPRGYARARARLRLLDLSHPARARALPGGTKGLSPGGPGPVSIDLYGTRLAYVWELIGPSCRGDFGEDQFKEDPITTELWLGSIHGQQRRLALGCSFDPVVFFQSPSFASGRLSYVAAGPGENATPPRTLRTLRLSSGSTSRSGAPSCVSAVVRSSDAVYVSRRIPCSAEGPTPPIYEVTRTVP